jgi:ABC-type branched-subunit amino acid transport system ATPase component
MEDRFGHRISYLRVSITDRCNERCTYCMPHELQEWLPREDVLTYEETLRLIRIATELGVTKVRITGGEPLTRRVGRSDAERAAALLADLRLAHVARLRASELSYGQRKLLEFAAVLMSSPRLVLLDEPTAGVNPVLVETMERFIRERHKAGTTFLVVEHDLNLVMRLCDPVILMDTGRQIFTGSPAEVQANPVVLEAYLGA